MVLIWDGSDATAELCFPPAGRRALLLPRPGEREGGLPRGLIHLQRPAVSPWSPLMLAVWAFPLLLLAGYPLPSPSLPFAPLSPASGMFDDGVHMYLMEPLRPTHSAVSYRNGDTLCSRKLTNMVF